MHQIYISGQSSIPARDLHDMYHLRFSTFKQRLNWNVLTENDEERDAFDRPEAVYILAKTESGEVEGCWRLLPTTSPYMLRDTFPELLYGQPAPNSSSIWELSRFAVRTRGSSGEAFSFRPLTLQLMAKAVEFAKLNGIECYVTVTSVAVERLLKRQGLNVHRIGPPMRLGEVLTVACVIEIDDITSNAVSSRAREA
jgi:acyl homoserine lactone synthase